MKVLLVYFGHMRRRRSSDVIQIFMRRLVEMNRIKFSVHQFSSKVRRINEACRRYLKVRRERLRKLHKVLGLVGGRSRRAADGGTANERRASRGWHLLAPLSNPLRVALSSLLYRSDPQGGLSERMGQQRQKDAN